MLAILLLAGGSAVAADRKVTIHRDSWGVPHIYAENPADGAYGLGYAQAEDRLDDIYAGIRTGMGLMSEAFGPQYVEQDYIMRLCRNSEIAKKSMAQMPPHVRTLVEDFTAGIQAYVDEHPDQVPEYAVKLEPWQIITIGRAMILRWPLGTINDEKNNAKSEKRPPMGSNEWVVAPSRSAEKVPILLSDPHLTWEGLAVLYEARVHAGDLHMNGFFVIGSPILGIGHNQHVGWALTTGGPDTADVYEMKIRLNPLPEYEYDGKWKPFTADLVSIPVKGAAPVQKPALFSHLGPVISEPDLKNGTVLVGAAPMIGMTGLMQQGYEMVMSKNCQEFFQAVGKCEFNEQNVMFADVHGDIGYVRCGATPIRPEGYDWDRPVPGHTSKTAWQGLHKVEDLVHVFNPPQGYMQNCNISPFNMMKNSPLTAERYREYIYNVSWDTENPRSMRIRDLLDADQSVTKDEAVSYAMDVFDVHAATWQEELKLAVESVGKDRLKNPQFAAAVKAIREWDGLFTPGATATALYKFWRMKLGTVVDLQQLQNGGHFDAKQQAIVLDVLQKTIDEMETKYGKWNIAWGDLHRVGRGDQLYPVGGTDFQSGPKELNFTETLFDVRSKDDSSNPGKFVANSGSMAVILMFFHPDGIQSLTCTPWGQNANPKSPHFADQGEKLYSQGKMKPTWWAEKDLKQNIESSKTLTIKTAAK
ncbi:MAG: penicillin acylase family protein [Planctomycetaceae bacterium]